MTPPRTRPDTGRVTRMSGSAPEGWNRRFLAVARTRRRRSILRILGLVAGDQFNLLQPINGFPRIPVGEGDLTTVGIVAALVATVVAALVPLVAAILGGKAGMRFHRKVDEAGPGLR